MSSILIVEDVEEMRGLLEHVVSGMEGMRVSGTAKNVLEARLELGRRMPELVLLDEVLPGESSVDLLAEIVEMGIPVLLITELENPSHVLPPGAAARLAKPTWETLEEDRKRIRAAIVQTLSALSG